jgi:hypothetical protein
MSDDKPEHIKGAKLVDGTWQDMEGRPLSNADLIKLREAQAKEKDERVKEKTKPE